MLNPCSPPYSKSSGSSHSPTSSRLSAMPPRKFESSVGGGRGALAARGGPTISLLRILRPHRRRQRANEPGLAATI